MKKQFLSILCLFFISLSYAQGPIPGCTTTTWNGTDWYMTIPPFTQVDPDLDVTAIIPAPFTYDTATFGSFESCQLLIADGADLIVNANTYVTVRTNAIVNGDLLVQDKGSFVQIDPIPNPFILGATGTAKVEKRTSLTDSATEVTYWSSPVAGQSVTENIGQPGESWSGYRYSFNTTNFNDATFEVTNDNSTNPGVDVDRIDDEGDDWYFVTMPDTFIMEPGFGIIARQAPGTTPAQVTYDFDGPFHSGTYTVDFERNDVVTGPIPDQNPAFTGNPYASAIDVDVFFQQNLYNLTGNYTQANPGGPDGIIDGVVYLWSHYTAAAADANGNQVLNFNINNYASINGSMQTAGGDGLPNTPERPRPNRFIPSAQGFFVNLHPDRSSRFGNIVFTNAMRVNGENGENGQFFRSSNSNNSQLDNKLWLNITSNNGFGQEIGLAYLDGATSNYDGRFYDTEERVPSGETALLYFNVDGTDEKITIQGKATNDLNRNEIVSIGFVNAITEPNTEFSITINEFQGDFMSNRTIYLNDSLLDVCHDLSASSYTFTSEVGEFNDRFTLSFLDCSFSDTCSAVYDEVASFVEKRTQCGKYTINFPSNYDFSNYDLVLTQDGVDTQLTEDTNIYFTENGLNEVTLSIYDSNNELCYSNEIIREVDCFNDKCGTCEDAFTDIMSLIEDKNQCGKFKIVFPKRLRDCYSLVVDTNGVTIPMEENTTIRYQEDGIFTLNITLYDKETGQECYTGSTLLTVDCYNNTSKSVDSVDEEVIEITKGMKLFPNPATNEFTVKLDDASEELQQLTLRSIMGKVIKKSKSQTVQLNGLRTGIYFVEIVTKNGNVYRKQLIVK